MALIFNGHSKCLLCDDIIISNDNVASLPPSSKKNHPLYNYFDGAFHKDCFDNWDKKEEVLLVVVKEKIEFESSDYYKDIVEKVGNPKI